MSSGTRLAPPPRSPSIHRRGSGLLHHLLHLLLLEAHELLSSTVGKAALQGARLLGVDLAQVLRRQEIIQRAQQVGVKDSVRGQGEQGSVR